MSCLFIKQGQDHSKASKKCLAKFYPDLHTFSGNFTKNVRGFDVVLERRSSMKKDILDTVMKRTETAVGQELYVDDNPMYEDPRDFIGEFSFSY